MRFLYTPADCERVYIEHPESGGFKYYYKEPVTDRIYPIGPDTEPFLQGEEGVNTVHQKGTHISDTTRYLADLLTDYDPEMGVDEVLDAMIDALSPPAEETTLAELAADVATGVQLNEYDRVIVKICKNRDVPIPPELEGVELPTPNNASAWRSFDDDVSWLSGIVPPNFS